MAAGEMSNAVAVKRARTGTWRRRQARSRRRLPVPRDQQARGHGPSPRAAGELRSWTTESRPGLARLPRRALIGEAQNDPALRADLLERYLRPRRADALQRLQRARDEGQLPGTLNLDDLADVIFGAVYHRLLLRNGPLDKAYARFVIDTVLTSYVTKPPHPRTPTTSRTGRPGATW